MVNTPIINRGAPNQAPRTSGSHPMVVAAQNQGQGILNKVTCGGTNKCGSGISIGGGGASAPIVGPGGTRPTPTPSIIGPNRPIVGPGGENPLGRVQDRVVNSLIGTGSLNSTSVHIGSIQKNVSDALNAVKGFNNTTLQTHLKNAQDAINRANKMSNGPQKNLALMNAQESLRGAGYELQKMGYGSKHITFEQPGTVQADSRNKLY